MQLKAGAKAEEIYVDKGMSVLKPACVEWMMQSWKMLREKGKMIRRGWTSIGLDKTFDLQFATAAAKKILSGSMSATGIDEEQEDDDISDADAQQVADEENDSDLAADLQDDEDDATVEEALAAAIEDRCVLGVRRSARLQGNDIMRSYHIASQLQNQILNCIDQDE